MEEGQGSARRARVGERVWRETGAKRRDSGWRKRRVKKGERRESEGRERAAEAEWREWERVP